MTNLSLMYSSGLDSRIAYTYAIKAGYKPQAIFVDLGHPYAYKEWNSIQKLDVPVDKINMSDLYPLIAKRLTNQIIPSRNVMLATIGSMFNSTVWINALDGEANGKEHDKSHRFFRDASELLSFTNEFFQDVTNVTSPFLHMTKADTIRWALENDISEAELFETTSCYNGDSQKCGICLTCYKRYTAFLLNNIEEPGYEKDPLKSDYAKSVAQEMIKARNNNDFSRFTRKRVEEHFKLFP